MGIIQFSLLLVIQQARIQVTENNSLLSKNQHIYLSGGLHTVVSFVHLLVFLIKSVKPFHLTMKPNYWCDYLHLPTTKPPLSLANVG